MYAVSIKAVLFAPSGEVVLLLNERDEWDLPGGRIEQSESPPQCLVREVREELGVEVEVGRLLDTHLFEVLPGKRVFIVAYHCILLGAFNPTLSSEHRSMRLFDVDALPANIPPGYRRSIETAQASLRPAGVRIQSARLNLVLQTPAQARAAIADMDAATQAQVSPGWLQRLADATLQDPWVHSFYILHHASGASIGQCGFKAPPDARGAVEIAYGIAEDHQRRGYATEAAKALKEYAFSFPQVRTVLAHTLPASVASKRVLMKSGFREVGDVVDPEDGLVSRFEAWRP